MLSSLLLSQAIHYFSLPTPPPPLPNTEKTHLIAGANVLFLLSVHSHQRPTRTVTSNCCISFTFIDNASIVARETKQHIEFRTTEKSVFQSFIRVKHQLVIFSSHNIPLTLLSLLCHLLYIQPRRSRTGGYKMCIYSSAYKNIFITWCSKYPVILPGQLLSWQYSVLSDLLKLLHQNLCFDTWMQQWASLSVHSNQSANRVQWISHTV